MQKPIVIDSDDEYGYHPRPGQAFTNGSSKTGKHRITGKVDEDLSDNGMSLGSRDSIKTALAKLDAEVSYMRHTVSFPVLERTYSLCVAYLDRSKTYSLSWNPFKRFILPLQPSVAPSSLVCLRIRLSRALLLYTSLKVHAPIMSIIKHLPFLGQRQFSLL